MLELDLATVLWQMLNFLILTAVLGKLLFRPALNYMRRRAAEVEQSMSEAADAQAEAEALRRVLQERLDGAREEADRIIESARAEVEERTRGLLLQAEAEAEAVRAEAESKTRDQRAHAIAEVYEEILDTVIDLTAGSLKTATSPALCDELFDAFNSEIWNLGQTDRERVETYRRTMAERQPLARVYTPVELSPEQQRTLTDTLSALINRPVTLATEIDPDLIAGIKVRLGDSIIDYSMRHQLTDLRDDLMSDLSRRLPV